jgi:hypothetical protein
MMIYSLIPSTIMAVFDCLLIKSSLVSTTYESGKKRSSFPTVNVMNRRRREFTVSLLVVTFLFLAMTLPASICYAFFKDTLLKTKSGLALLCLFDFVHFLNRSILFPTCFLTNVKFRTAVYKLKSTLTQQPTTSTAGAANTASSCIAVNNRSTNQMLIFKL